jgi:transaldolase
MSTLIEILETQLNVDVDSMDPNVAKSLPFTPHNMTSNQFVVLEQMQAPENRELLLGAVKEYGDKGWEAVLDRIVSCRMAHNHRTDLMNMQSALLCAENIGNIQGRVLLQTSPFYAYDTQSASSFAAFFIFSCSIFLVLFSEVVDHARRYAVELERVGISKLAFDCRSMYHPYTKPGIASVSRFPQPDPP